MGFVFSASRLITFDAAIFCKGFVIKGMANCYKSKVQRYFEIRERIKIHYAHHSLYTNAKCFNIINAIVSCLLFAPLVIKDVCQIILFAQVWDKQLRMIFWFVERFCPFIWNYGTHRDVSFGTMHLFRSVCTKKS